MPTKQKTSPVIWAGRLVHSEWRKSHELCFRKRFQAFGADVHAPGNTISGDGHFLNIGLPLTIRSLFGMADIMSELDALATDVTLSHIYSLVNNVQTTRYIIPQQATLRKSEVSNESWR
jgi:hypothetical protein